MKCQRQILRIRWQDHVRNDEVAARTGLRTVMESIRRRRHLWARGENVTKHSSSPSTETIQVEASVGRRPDRDWVHSSGHPRNR